MNNLIIPILKNETVEESVLEISKEWGFPIRPIDENDAFFFQFIKDRLQLQKNHDFDLGAVYSEFVQGSSMYRRKFGGGRTQEIAKAVGFKKNFTPSVLDATAGLGADAFVLASLGARVHMLERSPIVAALLKDGLKRAYNDKQIGSWVRKNLTLDCLDFLTEEIQLPFKPDVVYLDPMFPPKQKSALVKKDMRMLQNLLGFDEQSDLLLKAALAHAEKRVVVKRPSYAAALAEKKPDSVIETKKNRFDIYLLNK